MMNTSIASTGSAVPIGFCSFAADNRDNSMLQRTGGKENDITKHGQEVSFADSCHAD